MGKAEPSALRHGLHGSPSWRFGATQENTPMKINANSPRPRISSPLYEGGPWLKDPFGPDTFRHSDLGTPGTSAVNITLKQKNAGGSRRAPEPSTSVTSVHKAGKKR